jgi:hypothetical protein
LTPMHLKGYLIDCQPQVIYKSYYYTTSAHFIRIND